jgi:hypothetical protein
LDDLDCPGADTRTCIYEGASDIVAVVPPRLGLTKLDGVYLDDCEFSLLARLESIAWTVILRDAVGNVEGLLVQSLWCCTVGAWD